MNLILLIGIIGLLVLSGCLTRDNSRPLVYQKEDYCKKIGGEPDHSFLHFVALDPNYTTCSIKEGEKWITYEVVEHNGVFGLE